MKVIFVRHGETLVNINNNKLENNKDLLLDSDIISYYDNKEHINETGVKQAKLTGKYLKSLNYNFDLVISSPATRCIETTQHIIKEINYSKSIKIDKLIEEKVNTIYNGFTWKELDDLFKSGKMNDYLTIHEKLNNIKKDKNIDPFVKYEYYKKYGEKECILNGREPITQFIKKHKKFIKKLKKYSLNDNIKCILVVAHGTTLPFLTKMITNTYDYYNEVSILHNKIKDHTYDKSYGNTAIMGCYIENNKMKLIIPSNTMHLTT